MQNIDLKGLQLRKQVTYFYTKTETPQKQGSKKVDFLERQWTLNGNQK